MNKKLSFILFYTLVTSSFATNIVPVGTSNSELYYKIGGGSDFALPPVSETDRINLDANANLGLGNSCTSFNPAISIRNSLNNLKDSADNIKNDVLTNAEGSIIALPGYQLAKRQPTLYSIVTENLMHSHQELNVSTKNCLTIHEETSRGQNPYQDWATISINDQWKKKLSLTASGNEDINHAKKEIDKTGGDDGVNWVNGSKNSDGSTHAGGKNQPPVHVITDTTKAGYNTMLNRDVKSEADAPISGPSAELARIFPTPLSASNWIVSVVGDQTITTCNSDECKRKQGSIVGHGLLPHLTSCKEDKEDCTDAIKNKLAKLVTGNAEVNKDNLEKVSAQGVLISPDVISAIHNMDINQQGIVINKLAQEVAIQRIIDKAFLAKNILEAGAQVPVVAANHSAQTLISHAITNIDNDIRALAFEAQTRKQMVSDTISQVLSYSNQAQRKAMQISPASSNQPLIEDGALTKGDKNK